MAAGGLLSLPRLGVDLPRYPAFGAWVRAVGRMEARFAGMAAICFVTSGRTDMSKRTCAACDYELDDQAIQVRIGGQVVEVCCEACATKLKEAHASATASQQH